MNDAVNARRTSDVRFYADRAIFLLRAVKCAEQQMRSARHYRIIVRAVLNMHCATHVIGGDNTGRLRRKFKRRV